MSNDTAYKRGGKLVFFGRMEKNEPIDYSGNSGQLHR